MCIRSRKHYYCLHLLEVKIKFYSLLKLLKKSEEEERTPATACIQQRPMFCSKEYLLNKKYTERQLRIKSRKNSFKKQNHDVRNEIKEENKTLLKWY